MTHPIFSNPPLLEIVAEVRWGQGLTGLPQTFLETEDAAYMKLAVEVSKLGYNQFERVLPSGFPMPAGAVVYRYRKSDETQHTLFQLGTGLFTANALPPYSSWADFRSAIQTGLEAAYAAAVLPTAEPFQLILRYIDAFSGPSLCGRSPFQLMSEMLELQFTPPTSVGTTEGAHPVSARFSVEYPGLGDGILSIEMGQAQRDNADALIMNTRADAELGESTEPGVLLEVFDRLHVVLRDTFEEMVNRVKVDETGVA